MKAIIVLLLAAVLLLPAVDAQTAPAAGDLVIADAPNDAFLGGMPDTGAPKVVPLSGYADIVEAGIGGETETALKFHMVLRDLNSNDYMAFGDEAHYEIAAALDGSNVQYYVEWFVPVGNVIEKRTGLQEANGRLCLAQKQEEEFSGYWFRQCSEQRAKFTVDYDANRLEALVTKSALMGMEPVGSAPLEVHPVVKMGSRLSGIRAQAGTGFAADQAPDAGPHSQPFIFTKMSANLQIRLRADPPTPTQPVPVEGGSEVPYDEPAAIPDEWTVEPGRSTLIPLRLENANTAKRIVNLTAKLEKPDPSWQVQILPSIQVPGGDARVVTLVVNVTDGVAHRTPATVLVEGRSLGFRNELAAISLDLVASVSPGPKANVLHFHAAYEDTTANAICPFGCWWGQNAWLNLLEDDPAGTSDAGMANNMEFWNQEGQYRVHFELESPPTRALVFDRAKPFEMSLNFKTQVETPGQIAVEVSNLEGVSLGSTSQSATFKTGTPIVLSFLPEVDRVEANVASLVVTLTARVPFTGPGAASLVTDFKFVPDGSTLTLPLKEDALAKVTVPAGAGFISLTTSTDNENLINPGRTRLLNLTVVNEGLEADEARIEIVVDQDWSIDVRPGNSFLLRPGESAKFSVLVAAPADAKEGDQANILVNATSSKNPAALSQLRFAAIVVTGVDIPDEGADFQADEESEQKVAGGPIRNAPGAGAAALLALVALAITRRRA